MGTLYLAREEGTSGPPKLCVIKRIRSRHSEDPHYVERFANEAKTLVQLSHASIVQVMDMGIVDDEPYLALEYVDGKDLRRAAVRAKERGEPLPASFVLFVMGRVLEALSYVHKKADDLGQPLRLVHRDLSPQNILVSYEGEVKIIDFGLVKGGLNASETHPSLMLGTFLYMSPEQLRHEAVDLRTDLYAAGVCLYELLTGKNPFESDSVDKQLTLLMEGPEKVVRELGTRVSPALRDLLTRAMAVLPDDRYQSAEEFHEALQACLKLEDPTMDAPVVGRVLRGLFAQEYEAERRRLEAMTSGRPELASELEPQAGDASPPLSEDPLRETRMAPKPSSAPDASHPAPPTQRPWPPPAWVFAVGTGVLVLLLLLWMWSVWR